MHLSASSTTRLSRDNHEEAMVLQLPTACCVVHHAVNVVDEELDATTNMPHTLSSPVAASAAAFFSCILNRSASSSIALSPDSSAVSSADNVVRVLRKLPSSVRTRATSRSAAPTSLLQQQRTCLQCSSASCCYPHRHDTATTVQNTSSQTY